ncbi:MAG: hypothetical protein PF795_12795 [Kiritimatiellae bacterium]|jgi:putative transposase|nr:hypothetical protein [Kiritimatiellia bacterium]
MSTSKSHCPHIPTIWSKQNGNPKRGLRILPQNRGFFVHVTSRAVHQRFLFKDTEKAEFTKLMEAWADFSGLTVLTHCLLDNHFHLLLWVPPPQQVRFEEIVRRIRRVWPEKKVQRWLTVHAGGTEADKQAMKRELKDRMYNLPAYMRVLKQTFSTWFNLSQDVHGTLWEGRYRSMIVKDTPEALLNVATYIDLNPVRAGVCSDPKDYRWSGYGQATKANVAGRKGLRELFRFVGVRLPADMKRMQRKNQRRESKNNKGALPESWEEVEKLYRPWLYTKGKCVANDPSGSPERRKRRGFKSFEVLKVYQDSL